MSPCWMWSQSVPRATHRVPSCMIASHCPHALASTILLRCAQSSGSLSRRSDCAHRDCATTPPLRKQPPACCWLGVVVFWARCALIYGVFCHGLFVCASDLLARLQPSRARFSAKRLANWFNARSCKGFVSLPDRSQCLMSSRFDSGQIVSASAVVTVTSGLTATDLISRTAACSTACSSQ